MKRFVLFCAFTAAMLLFVTLHGADAVYKSVDESGQVTYSSEPPADAVTVEGVQLPAGPSEEATREAVEREKAMGQKADDAYNAITDRRRQEEEARKKAREEAQAAEEQSRAKEASEDSDAVTPYYVWPRHRHRWPPHPPQPPYPPWPPHPPQPPKPPLRGTQ